MKALMMKPWLHFLTAGLLGYLGYIFFILHNLDLTGLVSIPLGQAAVTATVEAHRPYDHFRLDWPFVAMLALWLGAGALVLLGCVRLAQRKSSLTLITRS